MKKVLFYTIPATLLLTLAIGYYAYAWTVDASATAYNTSSNSVYSNGTAYASGLNDHFAEVKIKHNPGGGWANAFNDSIGPQQGSAQMFASRFFPEGRPVRVYAQAKAKHDDGAPQRDTDNAAVN